MSDAMTLPEFTTDEIKTTFYDREDVLKNPPSPAILLETMLSLLSGLDENISSDGSNIDFDAFKSIEAYLLSLWHWNKELTYTIRIMYELDMPVQGHDKDQVDVLPLPDAIRTIATSLHKKLKTRKGTLPSFTIKVPDKVGALLDPEKPSQMPDQRELIGRLLHEQDAIRKRHGFQDTDISSVLYDELSPEMKQALQGAGIHPSEVPSGATSLGWKYFRIVVEPKNK